LKDYVSLSHEVDVETIILNNYKKWQTWDYIDAWNLSINQVSTLSSYSASSRVADNPFLWFVFALFLPQYYFAGFIFKTDYI